MTIKLYCNACHTVWDESCWREWQTCPFTDCGGKLTSTVPVGAAPKPRPKKEAPTYPLLEASER